MSAGMTLEGRRCNPKSALARTINAGRRKRMFKSDLAEDRMAKKTSRRAFLVSAVTVGGGLYFWSMGIFTKKTETAEAGGKKNAGQASNTTPNSDGEAKVEGVTDAGRRQQAV